MKAEKAAKRAQRVKADPLWLRSWFRRNGTYHVEVRDPKLELVIVDSYRGDDHTLHIILGRQLPHKQMPSPQE